MDSKTTISQLRKKIDRINKSRNWHPNAKDLAISISLEVSELLEHFQWKSSEDVIDKASKDVVKNEEIEMEVADIIIYLGHFLEEFNIDLSEAVKKKIKKIDEKYPVDKVKTGGSEFYYQQKKKYRQ